jgi:hypothetical protein
LPFVPLAVNGNFHHSDAIYLYEQKFLCTGIYQNILYLPPKTDNSTSKNPNKGYFVRFFRQKTTHIPTFNAEYHRSETAA